jgi:hypothetical protein
MYCINKLLECTDRRNAFLSVKFHTVLVTRCMNVVGESNMATYFFPPVSLKVEYFQYRNRHVINLLLT